MRHRKGGYKLGRTSAHRTATLRNLAVALFEHGQIVTTEQRAKAVQPMVEKIITLAKRGDIHARRLVTSKLGHDRRAFAWMYQAKRLTEEERERAQKQADAASQFFDLPDADMVERNRYGDLRKAPRIVKHIFDNVAPRFADRAGGYTRIIKLGKYRVGDAGEHCLLQLVGAEEGPEIGGNPGQRRRKADRRTAFAAEKRRGFAKKGEAKEEAATT
ncbi:MAG: 50S ribosomal protein L17 [Phycisphaerales bacterium]|nr:50S ribosomal protein L17 [Phycisphaerales bacterium]